MKKGVCVALFSTLSASCAPKYVPPPTLPLSIAEINTPSEARKWLKTVLTYKHDEELYGDDFWAPCGLTYPNRAGDCDDYAICAAALLQGDVEKGYIVYLYGRLIDGDGSHAVFVYQLNQKWGSISNQSPDEFRLPNYNTVDDVLRSINFTSDHPGGRFRRYKLLDYSGVDLVNGSDDLESKLTEIKDASFFP